MFVKLKDLNLYLIFFFFFKRLALLLLWPFGPYSSHKVTNYDHTANLWIGDVIDDVFIVTR